MEEALPAAYMQVRKEGSEETVRKRIDMLPQEWNDEFGPDFYEFSTRDEYYLARLINTWDSDAQSHPIAGHEQITLLSQEELSESIQKIKARMNNNE